MSERLSSKVTRRRFLQGATTLGGAALLAACAPATPSVAPEATPGPITGPVTGGSFAIGMFQEDASLDPADITGWAGAQITRGIFDGLVAFDSRTSCGFVPGLAESWEISEDRTQITYHIRQGVKFHDGTDLNAEAVKWNYDRLMDPNSKLRASSGGAWGKYWTVEVLDEYTVRITTGLNDDGEQTVFTEPGDASTRIVSPTAAEKWGDEFGDHPVGTGPFRFVSWERGTDIVLERNPDYWVSGFPYADQVTIRTIVDDNVRLLSLKTGHIDMFPFAAAKDAAEVQEDPNLDILQGVGGYFGLMFNLAIPPFDNLANREAVMYGIDYNAINDVGYFNMGTLTNGLPIPPVLPWYDPSFPTLAQDLDMARQKLEEAGNPDGFSFKTVVPPSPNHRLVLEVMQSNLLPLGINMEVDQMERARYGEVLRADRNYANASWIGHAIYRHWEDYRSQYFTDSPTNFTNWNNDEADAIVVESMRLIGVDDAKRMELAKEWYALFTRDRPAIPFNYFPQLQYYNIRLQDFYYHCLGELAWEQVWVLPESA